MALSLMYVYSTKIKSRGGYNTTHHKIALWVVEDNKPRYLGSHTDTFTSENQLLSETIWSYARAPSWPAKVELGCQLADLVEAGLILQPYRLDVS